MTRIIYGTPVVHGVAYAPALWVHRPPLPSASWNPVAPHLRDAEIDRFRASTAAVAHMLFDRSAQAEGDAADVLAVAASLATDPAWIAEATRLMREGMPAAHAATQATEKFIAIFEATGGLMLERICDLRDVRDRVIAHLHGDPQPGVPHLDTPYILLANDLSPADAAGLNPSLCRAIVTQLGGPTSHTSINARQLGIPCVVAVRRLSECPEGTELLVDARVGSLHLAPDARLAQRLVDDDRARTTRAHEWQPPAHTADGTRVELLANIHNSATAQACAASGYVTGVGLFRTELAFVDAHDEPGIDAQASYYGEVFHELTGQKVVVRTFDAGSDKPIHYATLREEANPALGVRGIRTSGPHPTFLAHQLEAIAQAAASHPNTEVWVMAPMISTLPETEWFVGLVHEYAQRFSCSLRAGIMIEVPSAAILIDQLLPLVDFVSIGTNDLTQYTMAADRLSPDLAEYADPWQPAPLALVSRIAEAGRAHAVPVGVCGEAASDPLLACVLLGMGVTSLSMPTASVPGVGAELEYVTMDACRAAARAVLGARDAGDARYRARTALESAS